MLTKITNNNKHVTFITEHNPYTLNEGIKRHLFLCNLEHAFEITKVTSNLHIFNMNT